MPVRHTGTPTPPAPHSDIGHLGRGAALVPGGTATPTRHTDTAYRHSTAGRRHHPRNRTPGNRPHHHHPRNRLPERRPGPITTPRAAPPPGLTTPDGADTHQAPVGSHNTRHRTRRNAGLGWRIESSGLRALLVACALLDPMWLEVVTSAQGSAVTTHRRRWSPEVRPSDGMDRSCIVMA